MGYEAAKSASPEAVAEGAVGAGTGATVGKLGGMGRAMKSGIGSATVSLSGKWEGIRVSALAAVNAFGDVRDPESGELIAGCRESAESGEFVDTAARMKMGAKSGRPGENTTLVVVATNALLTKVEAGKLAQSGGIGMARAITPVWTTVDGDVVIALSAGKRSAPVNALGVAAAEAVTAAIVRAVRLAPTLGGVPGLKSAAP